MPPRSVFLEVTFICGDHVELLRSLVAQGLVSASAPHELSVHAIAVQAVPADWVAVDFGDRTLKARWANGDYVYVNGPDLVRIVARNYPLDVAELVGKLGSVAFEAANVKKICWWDNPKGPAYQPPDGTVGTAPLGFAMAFKGAGHARLMSRRWMERGPWRLLRGENDVSFLQFHDENAEVAAAVAQARPAHAVMSDREQKPLPLRGAFAAGAFPLQGTYVLPDRRLIVSVAGRTVSRLEMREAVAARYYQLLGPDCPLDNVVFSFLYEAELQAALPDLWLYGLEARLRDASGWHRKDDSYTPPSLEPPDWVRAGPPGEPPRA